ncbi:OmpA family protein [Sphingobacterium alkalisoli]|uniref:OmpA family protein n=1 Tax=Sphingobacterium alkalisoli TaxID=1874115 RepID=A0A4U0GZB2_9SPHI|nr:OmpA family protein [Sphingobacterium alkalisoli]TJY64590.1 OmpA family protein [Sphingobacterium alkalisoli]GGH20792.1 cell envelope biogenesis protein OmpA [Sphingobacterium alkalisoli]
MNRRYNIGNLRLLAVSLLLLGAELSLAQEQPSRRNRAELLYDKLEYANAAIAYEKLVDVKKPRTEDMERLADSYRKINAYELAENWYSRVVLQPDHKQESLLHYAEVLKKRGRYAEAGKQYVLYQEKYGKDESIARYVQGADSAVLWMKNPTLHNLKNEKAINTDLSEFGLVPTSGGVIYAGEPHGLLNKKSGMTGQSYLKVYAADRARDGELNGPNVMGDAFNNALYHIGPVAVNAEEDVLYVTRTYPGNDTEKYRSDGLKWRKQNLELKIYRKNGTDWAEEDFAYNNVKEYSLGHAALGSEGKVLYYASDMPGGHGGVDIWYSELQGDNSWGSPKNAGPTINSAGDEVFPNVSGDTLYFSSDGHVGMGGLDIYRAVGNRSAFSKPENLRYPINSAGDDFAYVVAASDGDVIYGYLSSNRTGGQGGDDIYSFTFAKPKFIIVLEGLTRNKETGELLPATSVTLFHKGKEIAAKGVTDKEGRVTFTLNKGEPYRLLAEKSGYHSDSTSIEGLFPARDTTVRVVMNLQPVHKVGDKFVLENIYYDFDKHNIRRDAALILDQLVATMRDNPTLRIELSSHTDSRGSDGYNEKLSQRRAQSAVDYMVTRGIARDRMVAKGYGEKRLVNRCSNGVPCSIADHQANRRTEIEVLAY